MSSEVAPGAYRARRSAKQSDRTRKGTPIRGLLPLVVILGVWQLVGAADSPYFPPPGEWVKALEPLLDNGTLMPALGWTAATFVVGLAMATLLGFVFGVLMGSNRIADRTLGPTVEFLRILPAAALVPVAVLILGYTLRMKLGVVVVTAAWPILLTCRSGRRSMSPVLLDVPRTLGLSRWDAIRKVVVPALVGSMLLGVRVAAPIVLIITLLVEILTRINGLGSLLATAQASYLSARVYGLLMIAGILGFLVNYLVALLEVAVSKRMGPGSVR